MCKFLGVWFFLFTWTVDVLQKNPFYCIALILFPLTIDNPNITLLPNRLKCSYIKQFESCVTEIQTLLVLSWANDALTLIMFKYLLFVCLFCCSHCSCCCCCFQYSHFSSLMLNSFCFFVVAVVVVIKL